MSDSVRITIRLTSEVVSKLEELVKRGEYKNISEVVRGAIQKLLQEKFPGENMEVLFVEIPKVDAVMLRELVERGADISENEAIRHAIREYINRRVRELASKKMRDELREMPGE
jgi:CopG family nickel-responsive transcriptional regulator